MLMLALFLCLFYAQIAIDQLEYKDSNERPLSHDSTHANISYSFQREVTLTNVFTSCWGSEISSQNKASLNRKEFALSEEQILSLRVSPDEKWDKYF